MTKRLYYTDSYTTQFEATIIDYLQENGRFGVILNQTLFYPTSGGQPHDTGHLNQHPVKDVTIRKSDGAIIHWLQDALNTNEPLSGQVTWARRFDHMQHHSGQHILSQAFIQTAQANTIGFHLSGESVTIDLDNNALTPTQIAEAETAANHIVLGNRPITVRFVTLTQAQQLPIRKIPPVNDGKLRLIDVENYDLTACGGTHVAHTGEIGLIKVIRYEKRGPKLRVAFRCGWRAIADYGQKNETIQTLSATLTTGQLELVTAVTRLQEDNKTAQRQLKQLQKAQIKQEAQTLLTQTPTQQGVTILTKLYTDRDHAYLRGLQSHLTKTNGVVALLGIITSKKTQLLFARAQDAPGDMDALLKATLNQIGGSGGGSPMLAQGGGPIITSQALKKLLQQAANQIKQM